MATRRFAQLINPLISYTCDVFDEITPQKLATVTLIYEVIREALADLHGNNKENKDSAIKYFNSDVFDYHCDCVGIDTKLMLYIASNPQQYLSDMVYDKVERNESNF